MESTETKKYNESLGYRVNAQSPSISDAKSVIVYAERKNKDRALGSYGGDAYPAVYETFEKFYDGYNAGFVLDADGLGNGGFTHESLGKYLEDNTPADFTDNFDALDNPRNDAKLSLFLRILYGNEIFEQNYAATLEYALRCFSPVPVDGYFGAEKELWQNKAENNAQTVKPFYERDSQSLGSRIICVAIHKMLSGMLADKTVMNKPFAEIAELVLKNADKLLVDLEPAIKKLFKDSDADSRTIGRYVLPNTVAFWFYVYDFRAKKADAVAVSIGDARCYALDAVNGVRQISIDDAAEDGDITSLIHYGNAPKNDETHFDNKFRARMIELKAPCALMACSDGVYDTCPHVKKQGDISFGNKEEVPSDIMFEKNLLDALRDCYSTDDFKRKIVFEFYAQRSGDDYAEKIDSNGYTRAKRDDSATLAARFFDPPVALFDALRKNVTALDKLYDVIIEAKRGGIDIPYKKPHVESKAERDESKLAETAAKLMTNELQELLKKAYPAAFECMKESGSNTLWGVEHNNASPLSGFSLGQFFKKGSVRAAVFLTCVEDWKVCSNGTAPAEWKNKLHEHVIINADIYNYLKKNDFDKLAEKPTESGGDSQFDKLLELYAWFEKCFYGVCEKPRGEVWGKADSERAEASLDEIKAIVGKYGTKADTKAAPAADAAIGTPDIRTEQNKNTGTDDKGDN